MSKAGRVAVSALSAALACVLAVLLLLPRLDVAGRPRVQESASSTPAAAMSAADWQARLEACVPANGASRDAYMNTVVLDCTASAYLEAATAGQVNEAADATKAAIDRNPFFAMVCHEGAHDSGEATLARFGGDVVAALASYNGSITCEGGFIHGITDAFAKASPAPSDERFAELAKACHRPERGDFYAVCAHGYGHSAWIARQDPLQAAQLCTFLPDEAGREQCGDGIMMDMYYPAGEGIQHRDLSRAPGELPQVCANWPHPELPGMRTGCVRGAAFIFTRPLFEVLEREGGTVQAPYDSFPQAFLDSMARASQVAIDSCYLMPEGMGAECEEVIVVYLVSRPEPMLQQKPLREAVCSGITREKIRQQCVDMEYRIF